MTINLTQKQKKIAIICGAAAIVIAGAVTAFVFLLKPVPPAVKTENASKIAKFVASDDFAKMDKNAQAEYMRQVGQDSELRNAMWSQRENMSESQRDNMRQNMRAVREQQMQERMDKYFALKTTAEKKKFLDEILVEMQKRGQNRPPRRERPRETPTSAPAAGPQNGTGGNGSGGQANRPSRDERRKARIESSSPQARAQARQFRADLRARAKELGIPMPSFHGR